VKQASVLRVSEHIAVNGRNVHRAFRHEVRGNFDGSHELEELAPRPGPRPRGQYNVAGDFIAGCEYLIAIEAELERESNGLARAIPE